MSKIWLCEKCPRCGGTMFVELEDLGMFSVKKVKYIKSCMPCSRSWNLDGSPTAYSPIMRTGKDGRKLKHVGD